MKKIVSIILIFIIVCGCLNCLIFTSANAVSGIEDKISTIRNVYNTGSYFTASGNACASNEAADCYLPNIPSRGGLPSGSTVAQATGNYGYSCFSFAVYVFYNIFGCSYSNSTVVDISNAKVGDFVHLYHSTYKDHYGIYLGQDANNYYVYDSNGDGSIVNGKVVPNNRVTYYNSFSKATYSVPEVYHAKNYDSVNGSTSLVLAKNFDGVSVNNSTDITFSWNTKSGISGYNLYVAKNISGTVNYDWDNARIYLPGITSTQHTFAKGTLTVGNYAAYVQAINLDNGEVSEQSNFIYFNIYNDESSKPAISLSKSFNGSNCSSYNDITFNWSTVNDMSGYNLYVAKNINGTNEYDWTNARIYLPGVATSYHTLSRGTLSAGNYAAFVQSVNLTTEYTSRQSNFIYFNVFDEILYDIYNTDNAVFDVNSVDSFQIRGWAINTGKKEVTNYLYIDGTQIILDKQQRTDVYNSPLYSDFCMSEYVGFVKVLDLSQYALGEHTIKVVASSSTTEKVIFDSTFQLIGTRVGDIEENGIVDINDVTAIQKHLAKINAFDETQLLKADVNGDNEITIRDATMIQLFLAKLIESF